MSHIQLHLVNEAMRLLGKELNPADLWFEHGDFGNVLIVLYANPETQKYGIEQFRLDFETLGRTVEAVAERLRVRTGPPHTAHKEDTDGLATD